MVRKHHVVSNSALAARRTVEKLPVGTGDSEIDLIECSGLVGMGGAGFPTWKKLSFGKSARVVIANAVECEPLLAHNIARLETDTGKVLSGLRIAMHIVGASRGIVAIKAKNVAAIGALRELLPQEPSANQTQADMSHIELALLRDRYPAGDERAIVRDVLGTLLPVDAIPMAAGAVVLNVETLMRIHEAVVERRKVTTKDITVTGSIEGSGFGDDTSLVLYDVPIGISITEVLDALGIVALKESADVGSGQGTQLLLGGPYMGTMAHADDPITATSGGIMIAGPELADRGPIGIIVCACGASEERLRAIAQSKGAVIAGVELCKNAVRLRNGRLKCRNPGVCPGQAAVVLALRKQGAESVLISHCTDCTNTVMEIAPKLGMRIHHVTDAFLRAGGEPLIRRFRKTQAVHEPPSRTTADIRIPA